MCVQILATLDNSTIDFIKVEEEQKSLFLPWFQLVFDNRAHVTTTLTQVQSGVQVLRFFYYL